jgi:hypothetical protein
MNDALVPDDRDWTWVLERPCPECGFVASEFDPATTGDALRRNAESWTKLLASDAETLRRRRRPDRWSDLEYAAHVRDVHRLYLERLDMMLSVDDPMYPNWDQDATAVDADYNAQDPDHVSADLRSAAEALAAAFDIVSGDQWGRRGRRSDGANFTVDSFARYLVHDPMHHLWDVTGVPAEQQS